MALTQVQAHSPNITLPSIHLGSFSQYPTMPADNRRSSRFADVVNPDDNTPYPQQQQQPQPRSPRQDWRGPYPPISPSNYRSYSPARQAYPTTPVSSRINPIYPAGTPPIPLQPPNSPAQVPGPPKELCLECMMRDEDMADVDVTSPGVWDRESDICYQELCRREEEEEMAGSAAHANSSSGVSSSLGCSPRPRARGSKLTEGNLAVWNTLNPPEPTAKQQTLLGYLDAQNTLLRAETRARQQAMKESKLLEEKMRNAYAELRQSTYEPTASPEESGASSGGVKIRNPSIRGFVEDPKNAHKRDTTLLENGLIVERVDVRKEEARMRKEERRARKMSRDSLAMMDERDRQRDAMSLYSLQAVEASSLRAPAPYESTTSVPMPTNRSVRSMYTIPSTSWQAPTTRPFSMAGAASPGFASQTSLTSTASPRRRFFGGMRKWSGYFGSTASLAQSGSMMDMHLGLDQEKQLARSPGFEGPRSPPIHETEPWPRLEDPGKTERHSLDSAPIAKKKKRGLSRLWKIFTAPGKSQASPYAASPRHPEDDLPLAPPPPLSYLVNRGSMQLERPSLANGRQHVSMPSLSMSQQKGHHPRSNSIRSAIGISLSSPSDQSSTLPSPTEARFPPRDHGPEIPDDGAYDDDPEMINKRRASGMDLGLPVTVSPPPIKRQISASSPLVPTTKPSGTVRPISVLSLDKNLPPLPTDDPDMPGLDAAPSPEPTSRPSTAPMIPMTPSPRPQHSHTPSSMSGYRSEDMARRQSFNGLASYPASSLPAGARRANIPGVAYNEFGASRHSVASFDPSGASGAASVRSSKRKSRFGLGLLLGKKEKEAKEALQEQRLVASMPNERTRQVSYEASRPPSAPVPTARSVSHPGLPTTMSTVTRRPLQDLIQQEPDFVAYRYPSKDEPLNLC